MKNTRFLALIWVPRVFGILFIVFISLFALDVFSEGFDFQDTAIPLFMHLIPTIVLTIALILAWRQKLAGALLYIGFGSWYLMEMMGKFQPLVYLVMAGIPIVLSALFVIGWAFDKKS